MKVISESYLRDLFRKEVPGTFRQEAGQIMTPSAAQFLGEKGVKVIKGHEDEKALLLDAAPKSAEPVLAAFEPRYVSAADGGFHGTKPVHMTELSGNRLISKDHPRIAFRGRMDSFQAEICLLQARASGAGKKGLVEDLQEIMAWTWDIMGQDVLDKPITEKLVMGLTCAELRERSHNPKNYFKTEHLSCSWEMGIFVLELNRIRALVREIEVFAVTALKETFELEKPDIVQVLNHMSQALYIMMLKDADGIYGKIHGQ